VENEGADGDTPKDGFASRYGWLQAVNNLSNNQRDKWEYYFQMSVVEFLNTLAFFKELNQREKEEMETERRRSLSKR
jgi:hypothetical protein